MNLILRTIAILVASVTFAVNAAETSAPLTFERHIRPILKAKCFQCHGEDQKTEGELDLRLRRFIVAGGESGPAVVPGKPSESYLLERLQLGEMPPGEDTEKLNADEVAFLQERADHFRAHPPVPIKRTDVPGSRSRDTGPQTFDVLIRAASKTDAETLALALLCQMLMSSNEFLYVG